MYFAQEDWVLCRVFYKKKGDESYTDNSSMEFDAIDTGCASQLVDQPNQLIGYNNEHMGSFQDYNNNPIIDMGLLHFNEPDHIPQETMNQISPETVDMDSRDGDYYMFLLNMGIENQDLVGGGATNIEGLRVHGENGHILY
ncbi:NAC domain-containing protein 21/22-like protein [Carex littledalei]|uniref:NAC domain-containing protein 21/22-like protein n=1 Tax=Carex littledalei TaxID=544730 RepID=A0A833RI11_9POAL|nr:NAC domain-containing protein 21/22-like protein [Carex littledalei]